MKFSFVIPSINQFTMLFNDCIDTLVAKNGSNHEVIVVDDGSDPNLRKNIADECRKRGILLIENEQNLGFPKTVNRGMKAATGDYIVLVNNDIKFTHNVIDPIERSFAANDRIGIVGGLLLYPHGTIQHGGIISTGPGMFTHRAWHKNPDLAPEAQQTDYMIAVTGALFAIRRQALNEIGFMNEEYFLSCDDTEYCLRAWQKNWRVLYTNSLRAIHAEGVTRGANDRDKLHKNRTWYINERKTMDKFYSTLNRFDWKDIENRVKAANLERLSKPNPNPVPVVAHQCEVKRYGEQIAQDSAPAKPKIPGKKVLIRRTGALGDVLLTTGVIKRLKEEHPEYDLTVATICGDIFNGNPNVAGVVRLASDFPNAEIFYDLDTVYESTPKMHVIEAYERKIFGHHDESYDYRPELFSTDVDYGSLSAKIGPINFDRDKVAVLHMSVGWASRTWPQAKWDAVARIVASSGYKVVVIGRGADYRSNTYTGVLNLVDHLSVHEVRELLKRSSVFVGMDSGMLHVAMTTDCPAVGIFTVANPDFRICKRSAPTIAMVPKIECRYCLHEQPPPVQFVACKFGTNICLDEFTPENVVAAMKEVAR